MTKQTLVVKSGDTWEWEDTPELKAFRSDMTTPNWQHHSKKDQKEKLSLRRCERERLRHFKKCHMKTPDQRRGSYTMYS